MKSKKSASRPAKWENPVKAKLNKGESVIGIVISVNSVEVAAQAAAMGFDFVWMEMEHSPISLETVRNVVLATRGLPAVPFARVPRERTLDGQAVAGCRRARCGVSLYQHAGTGATGRRGVPLSALGLAGFGGGPRPVPLARTRRLL